MLLSLSSVRLSRDDVWKRQDVDEFLLVFLDRLETQLKGLPQKRLLQHVFG